MRLYSMQRNSAGWRVRIALHVKGLAFDYVPVRTLGPGEYRRLNPQGLMPALDVDGVVIAQSGAILEYLEELAPEPALLPRDPLLRAQVRAFSQLIACDLHPLTNHRVRRYLSGSMGRSRGEVQAWYEHWVMVGLGSLEEMLAARPDPGPFCFGERPSFADLHLVPQLYNCRRFGCQLRAYGRLLSVEAACRQHPAFLAAAPERLPDFDGKDPPWTDAPRSMPVRQARR